MEIGANIRNTRKEKGLSQVEVSQNAGIAVNSLRLYEAGKRQPNLKVLKKIADALGVEVWELADFDTASRMLEEDINHKELLEAYDSMNDAGQAIAFQTVKTLADMPEYQKKDEPVQK